MESDRKVWTLVVLVVCYVKDERCFSLQELQRGFTFALFLWTRGLLL